MKELELTSINFETLKKFEDIETQESVVYHDDKKVYKLYKNFNMYDLIIREMHVEETSKITNFKMAQPLEKIINNEFFCGCTMELKKGITLSKFEQNHSISELKDKLIDISEGLEEIHLANKGLVLGDINYNNIIVDEANNDFSFIDIDGAGIKKMEPMGIPFPLYEYLELRNSPYKVKQNYDRLTFLLAFYHTVFNKSFDDVSEDEFERKTDEIPFLNRSRYDFKVLKKKNKTIKEVPYFHEIFSK